MAEQDRRHLDPEIPAEALLLYRKIACNSLDDAAPRFEIFSGRVFSHRPGQIDRYLFDVIGSNVSRCETIHDPVRGTGFRKRSNVILLYVDPETGDELETIYWGNDASISASNAERNRQASFSTSRRWHAVSGRFKKRPSSVFDAI